jgi:integrase
MKQRADGRYIKKLVVNGKPKYFYGSSSAEVDRKLAAYKGELKNGRPFATVAREWQRMHDEEIEYYTRVCYAAPLNDLIDTFGTRSVITIRPLEVQAFLNRLAKQGRATQTIKLRLQVMHMIYVHLIMNQEVESDITFSCRVPKTAKKPKAVHAAEQSTLAKIEANVHLPEGLLAFLLAYTGCRPEEAYALSWDDGDIDFDRRLIHVNKVVVYDPEPHVLLRTKSAAGERDIVMRDRLYSQLKLVKRKKGYLFADESGKLQTRTVAWKRWAKYREAIGEPELTRYQLRHAFATAIHEAGISAKDGISQTGHSATAILENTYQDVRKDRLTDIAKRLNRYDKKLSKSCQVKAKQANTADSSGAY